MKPESSKSITVQDFVSRPDSFRHKISEKSWDRGIENFFLEKIPFSFSTGHEYACRIISLIEQHFKLHSTPIRLVELGSGSGLLAYRILYMLHQQHYSFAKKVTFVVTDFSPSLVEAMKTSPIFDAYRSQVEFMVFNFVEDDYELLGHYDVIMMTYLLGALPHVHLKKQQDQLFEKNVRTYVDHDFEYVNTNSFLPEINTDDSIIHSLNSVLSSNDISPLSRCRENISEQLRFFKLKKHHPIYNDDLFYSFLESTNDHPIVHFNYSALVAHALNRLFSSVSSKAIVVIYDFGIPDFTVPRLPRKTILAQYGITLFHSTFFPLIHYLASQHQLSYLQTVFKAGDSQCCVVGSDLQQYKPVFKSIFSHEGGIKESQFIKKCKRSKLKGDDYISFLNKHYKCLTPFEKRSHSVLLTIAIEYKDRKLYDLAFNYIDIIEQDYGEFCLSSKVLKATIYNECGQYNNTINLLSPLAKKHRYHNGLLYHLCVAYIQNEDKQQFVDLFPKFIAVSDNFIPWRFFIIYALYQFQLNNLDVAKQVLTHIIRLHQQFPHSVSEAIALAAKEAYSSLGFQENKEPNQLGSRPAKDHLKSNSPRSF